jgi:hypothetical protein
MLSLGLLLVSCRSDQETPERQVDSSKLPIALPIILEGEAFESSLSEETWLVYVDRPLEEASKLLKDQLDKDGGWEPRSQRSYRKVIKGKTYEVSITKGKIPVGNEPDDQSLWETWTTLYVRRI